MARINITVTMKGIYSYEAPAYGYGTETRYIYNMVDENGKVYVWKTTCFMIIDIKCNKNDLCYKHTKDGKNWYRPEKINKGDVIEISATVKGESEYKGQPQTEVNRVKVVNRIFKAKTWEEIVAEREAEKKAHELEQRNSLQGEDFIWKMPYRQYKEHYADCETVENSFVRDHGVALIEVIVREGRLKASGVRGEHYSGYSLVNENGERIVYRAVKEENALKRAKQDFPNNEWVCDKIYTYGH